jgi:regulator of sirC expression with transglutaminase-like and TPR domain
MGWVRHRDRGSKLPAGFIVLAGLLVLVAQVKVCLSAAPESSGFPQATLIRSLLQQPEEQIDVGRCKLAIDKMFDPSMDVEGVEKQLDAILFKVRGLAGPSPSNKALVSALRSYIYEKGPWNDFHPYHYDFTDPMGDNLKNQEIGTYLATKSGNCASMPLLFVILGQRLGLPVAIAMAPNHLFVKYTDSESGMTFNLEATSGANTARDEWYRQQMPMTDLAISNGLYLRKLSNKETIAVMAYLLAKQLDDRREHEKAIALSDLILEFYPNDVNAMLRKGHAYYGLLKRDFLSKYPRPNMIPPWERFRFQDLGDANLFWYAKAESLGWREPTPEEEKAYEDKVKRIAETSKP